MNARYLHGMRHTKSIVHRASVLALTLFAGVASANTSPPDQKALTVIKHYADIAEAAYGDAAADAQKLQTSVDAFLAHPTPDALAAARAAWKAARIPYLQTEGFRFANTVVDDWEPRVNAWPLDEGLIDYVAPSYGKTSDQNPLYTLNVVANTKLRVGAKVMDATTIDKSLLRQLQEAEGVQTNVSTGYHAIEFLLWGQNLNGLTGGQGARPATDYDVAHCTNGNCTRRAAYLKAAVDTLVSDLSEMAADWKPDGKARAELLAKGADGGLSEILTGMGSLTFGEMAGERMKLGLMLHDPEEQQDCFSNNTHNSHYYDEIGLANLWRGRYVRTNGHIVEGPSLRDYATSVDTASAARLDHALDDALAAIKTMKDQADSGRMAYSQMIASGNTNGNKIVSDAMDSLVVQTRAIEGVAGALHLKVTSDKSDHSASAASLR